ncbi:MAG TPA: anaerobic glycerol-3-phosphate dehydrogenase subunit GlpB [Thermodesulfobacteriota bacterium]|nr:anaerobic glycerol-3-phosphate dehydrogenase subunit GlpB [Thermodesulfobacteriota bacterium]
MHYDVIIIGMGLSGLMAARTAAEAGQKVLIVGKGMGSLCLFSNTIDVLGRCPTTLPMKDNLSRWINDHPEHPYAKVGLGSVEGALTSFVSLFPPPFSFHAVDQMNCLLPTGAGTLRPTYLIPTTMTGAAPFDGKQTLIVGFEGFKDFYSHYVADQLKCRGINLQLPGPSYEERTSTALARLMEKQSFRENIGWEIKKQLHGETRLGFPAVLGMNDPIQVKQHLEEITDTKVFEIPILPPSVPGKRIFDRFKEWLIKKGVTFLLGSPVSKAAVREKRCHGIEVVHPPVITFFSADRFILATGRFMGGGLKADAEKIVEPIFRLPVHQPPLREGWFEDRFFGDLPHPVHQAGVLANASLQPVNEGGNVILENVWIAGSLLAHHQCIDEKSREGIEIATGYMAAKHALGVYK